MKDRVEREEALAKLGARLLSRDSGASSTACPGADTVAAYLEQTLDASERAHCEEHFAGCARCQGVLGGLARVETPAPLAQAAEVPSGLWPSYLRWQWLVPAAAVLAVGLVWTIVRPSLAPVLPSTVDQLGPPSREAEPAAVGNVAAVEADTRKDVPQAPVPAKQSVRRAPDETQASRIQAESKVGSEAVRDARAKSEKPVLPAQPIAQNFATEEARVARGERAGAGKAADATKPAAAPAPVERAAMDAQTGASRAAAARVVTAGGLTAQVAHVMTIIESPTPAISWRIGPAGSIERSVDSGRSWERQESGVRLTLISGSAPTETICWVVGQRGTIVRTTDGRTWQIVTPPAPVDFVSVSAVDGLVATVVAADDRRFTTNDGGRSWRAP